MAWGNYNNSGYGNRNAEDVGKIAVYPIEKQTRDGKPYTVFTNHVGIGGKVYSISVSADDFIGKASGNIYRRVVIRPYGGNKPTSVWVK